MLNPLIQLKKIQTSSWKMILMGLFVFLLKNDGITQDSIGLSQPDLPLAHSKKLNNKKLILATVQTSLWAGTLLSLDKVWYSKYEKSSFHTFNDWNEWQQMDKLGHVFSAYHINEQTTRLWEWAGTERKKSIIIGGISSLVFMNTIELLDAYSKKWGFSSTDAVSNLLGSGLYIGQAFAWKDQRIRLKISYHQKNYGDLNDRANQLFGKFFIERALKDYNGQTYWASFNLKSFLPRSNLPAWICFSIGYGSDNMLGGFKNEWRSSSGEIINYADLQRSRKFLFSADIDLTKIKTKNKVLNTFFSLLNTMKFPAPTIVLNTKSKPGARLFYF